MDRINDFAAGCKSFAKFGKKLAKNWQSIDFPLIPQSYPAKVSRLL
jgi:hypothetical protein